MAQGSVREVIIIGGGMAGLSAAIYLARSRRDTVVVHSDRSMAVWEPDVQNYLGFPAGISGQSLLDRGRMQAAQYGAEIIEDEVRGLRQGKPFEVQGLRSVHRAKRVLLATGLTHLPPEVPGVRECLGRSLFFCKDCDAFRLQGKRILVIGHSVETAEYALAMLAFTSSVVIATNGKGLSWDLKHQAWLREYAIPLQRDHIVSLDHEDGYVRSVKFAGKFDIQTDAVFTTRGDVVHNALAKKTGADLDAEGQIVVDESLQTTVPGLYAAGCVTSANCQMIIAAGQGATAAQAINRDLFHEDLRMHMLPRYERSPEQTLYA
ncbi:MAG: NAD(P)/FAD-dependent oxidoreductase [Nitrospiraceae bacterium]